MTADPVWLAVTQLWYAMNPEQRKNLVKPYPRLYELFEKRGTFTRDLWFSERHALIDVLTVGKTKISLHQPFG